LLGPTFSRDLVPVETSDHARLNLRLSYNWLFNVDPSNQKQAQKIFNIRDFIGDMCNLMAAKVRAAVASSSFEDFHKSSAHIIRKAIFGLDERNKINDNYDFEKNCLRIKNVDIQSVEPESRDT
jgi:major vault protein